MRTRLVGKAITMMAVAGLSPAARQPRWFRLFHGKYVHCRHAITPRGRPSALNPHLSPSPPTVGWAAGGGDGRCCALEVYRAGLRAQFVYLALDRTTSGWIAETAVVRSAAVRARCQLELTRRWL